MGVEGRKADGRGLRPAVDSNRRMMMIASIWGSHACAIVLPLHNFWGLNLHMSAARKFGSWICNGHKFMHNVLFVTFHVYNFRTSFFAGTECLNSVVGCSRAM